MEKSVRAKKLPNTDSIQELAKFWDTHDLTDFAQALEAEAVHKLRGRLLKLFKAVDSLSRCFGESLSRLGPKPLFPGQGEPTVDRQGQV